MVDFIRKACYNIEALYFYDAKVSWRKENKFMKKGIHPNYVETEVTCACGNTFKVKSNKPQLHLEVCDKCHPFYSGKQKLVDTAGRVEKFKKKHNLN